MPSISIIIPTYNHVDYLKACCDSIAKYTDLDNIEIIIVTNGCHDKSQDYVRFLGNKFILINFDEPIGFTRAINEGLKESKNEFIILLNDDTVLLKQPKNKWINLLLNPFSEDNKVGITGPVKFTWQCGEILRTAIGFWCCAFKRQLINEIGLLDEAYNPGMGEDGDFSIQAELIGYKLVQVPKDESKMFGEGVSSDFPIYHIGNGTFVTAQKNEIILRNNKILEGKFSNRLEKIYNICLSHPSDINELFPILRKYSNQCDAITEFGVRGVFSTYAFLASKPKKMTSYDIITSPNIQEAIEVAKESKIDFKFIEHDVLTTEIEPTDLLFIDTLHTYNQLSQELQIHSNKVRKYILAHDTETCKDMDESYNTSEKHGLYTAIKEFVEKNNDWHIKETIKESNGLTILEHKPKFSIIVPGGCDKVKDCIDSILKYTNLIDKEIIVVANGCSSNTQDYLYSLRKIVKLINYGSEKIGQVKPVNVGYKEAKGEYIILIDDDCLLLLQEQDKWINSLYKPFTQDVKTGISGPFLGYYPFIGHVIHSGCTMYKKEALDKINGFDESFGFGYLYDADTSLRIQKAGYTISRIGEDGTFPIYHPQSPIDVKSKRDYAQKLRVNRDILYKRHAKKPTYSIVIPTYNHLEDCLKPCCKSIIDHTNLEDVEVIVVANGCKDDTENYVDYLGYPFKLIWIDEGLGFTKATNIGIKQAIGDYVILLNNDTVLLDKGLPKNTWIEMLGAPFKNDDKVGITGPLQLYDNYAGCHVMIFFCACIRKRLFDEIGLLDESFSPGGGEDVCFSVEAQNRGYKQVVVPERNVELSKTKEGEILNVGSFPIYHKGEATFSNKEFPEYGKKIIKNNGLKNMLRYNKHIRLNLGSGGVEIPGYISVDKYDTRASIIMDIFDLDFPDNSVDEIIAIHLIEHLNIYRIMEVFAKWNNMLKPGGKLILEMPNFEETAKQFIAAKTWREKEALMNTVYAPVNTTNEGKPSDVTSYHVWGYWPEFLDNHLNWAGYVNTKFMPEQFPHPGYNFRVETYKRT